MQRSFWLPLIALLGLGSGPAWATAYTVNCGSGGPASLVQADITAIGASAQNSITVTGTCVGDLIVTGANQLTLTGLVLTGNLTLDSSTLVSLGNLQLTGGSLSLTNSHRINANVVVVNGDLTVNHGSQISISSLTMSSYSDSAGIHDPDINCIGQSECTFVSLNMTGTGTARGTGLAGLTAASASRTNVFSGTITGFDVGVQVWNNATAFLTPSCANINIQGNLTTGVFVSDGGIAKLEGLSPADAAAAGCPGSSPSVVYITHNGSYGVLADGGGNAYLYVAGISGHAIDGIRAQHGSIVRVRSSSIDAATSSGRAARLKAQSHLYFDEQSNGPTAFSSLAGPVCITENATVDTDNSATAVTVTTSCTSP